MTQESEKETLKELRALYGVVQSSPEMLVSISNAKGISLAEAFRDIKASLEAANIQLEEIEKNERKAGK